MDNLDKVQAKTTDDDGRFVMKSYDEATTTAMVSLDNATTEKQTIQLIYIILI